MGSIIQSLCKELRGTKLSYTHREALTQMSTQEVFVQKFANLFVHYSEALALNSENTQGIQMNAWNELPAVERDRMVAAARLALLEIETTSRMEDDSRRYYAKPGEAEWGC